MPDEDFAYYTDYEDLAKKVKYYLENDDERCRIAHNGCAKVRCEHTFKKRFETIFEVLEGI